MSAATKLQIPTPSCPTVFTDVSELTELELQLVRGLWEMVFVKGSWKILIETILDCCWGFLNTVDLNIWSEPHNILIILRKVMFQGWIVSYLCYDKVKWDFELLLTLEQNLEVLVSLWLSKGYGLTFWGKCFLCFFAKS